MIVAESSWYQIQHTVDYVLVDLLQGSHLVLSSAVLNGGLSEARHVLNLKVPRSIDHNESPLDTLAQAARKLHCDGAVVGLMTAASMNSFRSCREVQQGVELLVLVTCGLENARGVGDVAEYRSMETQPYAPDSHVPGSYAPGTINIILLTDARLTGAAMVEAVQMITEAKTAALVAAGITSPVSGVLATGTGTDAVAVVSGNGPHSVAFCGKHVLFGEVLGRLVQQAVADSVSWYQRASDQKQGGQPQEQEEAHTVGGEGEHH